ncbi:hypothetical protein CRI93_06935 [Longimonas halophila]|uniref:Peptidase S8/S53 domain-containing protein n=1 Tax=Longimonas halophila TaxID=1469170 RepID=A0A2H3NTU9_9BACT|nr:S8 family peptidase [Longimonas halophila]PEN07711.1 hypothetical protein CRI93_06935 [Longimonas halophila]
MLLKKTVSYYLVATFLVLLFSGSAVGAAFAQLQSMNRLESAFQYLLAQDGPDMQAGAVAMPLSLKQAQVERADGTVAYQAFIHTANADALRRMGIPVQSVHGQIATARLSVAALRQLSESPIVDRVEVAPRVYPHNDGAAAEVGGRFLNHGGLNETAYQGEGVMACIIDSGIDVTHRDFYDADGNVRIAYLWDQTDQSTGRTPADRSGTMNGLNFGREYTAADIAAGGVEQTDTIGHGTHIAGTLAGTGQALVEAGHATTPQHQGVAPKADLIVVKAGDGWYPTVNVADALEYCDRVGEEQGRPVVVNLSFGTDYGPHDGTSTMAQIVDDFTTPEGGPPGTAPGRVAVASAGNSGDPAQKQHVSATVAPGTEQTHHWDLESYETRPHTYDDAMAVNAWVDGQPAVAVTVTSPSGHTVQLEVDADQNGYVYESTPDGDVYIDSYVGYDNGDRPLNIEVFDGVVDRPPVPGTWTIDVSNHDERAFTYHAWTYWKTLPGRFRTGSNAVTVGAPATAASAITVGAYAHRWRWTDLNGTGRAVSGSYDGSDRIATFSSRGPTRDGRIKPELAAPGQRMMSATSSDMEMPLEAYRITGGTHHLMQGTSVSAPITAGSIALLLQEDPTLTAQAVRTLLMETARVDAAVADEGALPNAAFGAGKLDVARAMAALTGTAHDQSANERMLMHYEAPWTFNDMERVTVGATANDAIALRLSPSVNGCVTGVYLTLAHGTQANQLTAPLHVQIWSDDNGEPGEPLRTPVAIPPGALMPFTPEYVSLQDCVPVTRDTDYHVVIQPEASSDTVTLVAETASTATGRSQRQQGHTWHSIDGNLVVRAEVATSAGDDSTLPVELTDFSAQVHNDRVVVRWETLSETNNSGFVVEHRPGADSTASFHRVGVVEGHGTTAARHTYQFETDALPAGPHAFRLRQIDLDGTETVHAPVTTHVQLRSTYSLSAPYPNPSVSNTRFTLTVGALQDVTATVYNVLGQRVATVYQGPVQADRPTILEVNPSEMASGWYMMRVEGETFTAQRSFTRVR